jgi:hypothetical protein
MNLNGSLYCKPLDPIFNPTKKDFSTTGDLTHSPSLALISMGKESSILFYQKVLSGDLLRAVKDGDMGPLSKSLLKNLGYKGSFQS